MIIIDFNKPFIAEADILTIKPKDLSHQYAKATETEQFNLFFVLLTTIDMCEKNKKLDLVAYTAYLISYYLFVALTPPGSQELALSYAKKALEINPLKEYQIWYDFVQKGN